jgi:hypothetical protein
MTEEMANQFAGEILDEFISCSAFFRRIKSYIGHSAKVFYTERLSPAKGDPFRPKVFQPLKVDSLKGLEQ